MGKFFAGFGLAALLAGGAYFVLTSAPESTQCDARCGEGTECVEGMCMVAAVEVEAAPEEEESKGKKRKGKRRKKGAEGGETAVAAAGAKVDDSHVPRFDRTKTKTIGEGTGSERLSDNVINRELAKLDGAFQRCITKAAAAAEGELGSGRVKYEFGVAPSGKVTGVNVSAPAELKALGVDSCVRVALYGHSFPSFDGLEMGATGSFSI